jgi:cytoskeletal protein CcmA (bactofilin family)
MALTFGRGRNGEGGGEAGAPGPLFPAINSGTGLTAFIDRGSEFEGKLSFKDTVRIDGRFVGEITSENTLIVGESGEIEAKIRSQVVEVSGAVTGDVVATRKLILHKTARLEGNVETSALVMEEGASLNGRLTMAAPKPDGRKAAPKETGVPKAAPLAISRAGSGESPGSV